MKAVSRSGDVFEDAVKLSEDCAQVRVSCVVYALSHMTCMQGNQVGMPAEP